MLRSHVHMGLSEKDVYGYRKGQEVMVVVNAAAFNRQHPEHPFKLAADDDVPVVLSELPVPLEYLHFVSRSSS